MNSPTLASSNPDGHAAVTDSRQLWATIGAVGLLVFVVGLAFTGGLTNPPVAEDYIAPWWQILPTYHQEFRPVFDASMVLINNDIGPITTSYFAYHLYSIVVHLLAVIMFFAFARQLTSSLLKAVAMAAVFSVYPRNQEAVLWPVSSSHALAGAFLAAMFAIYYKGRVAGRPRHIAAAVALYGLALLSVEAAVSGLLLLALFELFWRQPGTSFITNLRSVPVLMDTARRLAPFVGITGLFVVVMVGGQILSRASHPAAATADVNFYHFTISPSEFKDYLGYVSYTILPFVPLRSGSTATKLAMALAGCVVIGVGLARGNRLVRFGLSWVLVSLVPYALFVPFGNADRYFYFASMGFSMALVGFIANAGAWLTTKTQGLPRRLIWAGGAIVAVLYMAASIRSIQAISQEWRAAGNAESVVLQQIYQDYPAINANQTFYFLNLPNQYDRVAFMGSGVYSALRSHYGRSDFKVEISSVPVLSESVIESYQGVASESDGVVIFDYQNGRLLDISSAYNDPAVRQILLTSTVDVPW